MAGVVEDVGYLVVSRGVDRLCRCGCAEGGQALPLRLCRGGQAVPRVDSAEGGEDVLA